MPILWLGLPSATMDFFIAYITGKIGQDFMVAHLGLFGVTGDLFLINIG